MPTRTKLRAVKYLNNRLEQDHHFFKRLTNPGLGFSSFHTARRTLCSYEAMNMIRKGQIQEVPKGDVLRQIFLIKKIFSFTAQSSLVKTWLTDTSQRIKLPTRSISDKTSISRGGQIPLVRKSKAFSRAKDSWTMMFETQTV